MGVKSKQKCLEEKAEKRGERKLVMISPHHGADGFIHISQVSSTVLLNFCLFL